MPRLDRQKYRYPERSSVPGASTMRWEPDRHDQGANRGEHRRSCPGHSARSDPAVRPSYRSRSAKIRSRLYGEGSSRHHIDDEAERLLQMAAQRNPSAEDVARPLCRRVIEIVEVSGLAANDRAENANLSRPSAGRTDQSDGQAHAKDLDGGTFSSERSRVASAELRGYPRG